MRERRLIAHKQFGYNKLTNEHIQQQQQQHSVHQLQQQSSKAKPSRPPQPTQQQPQDGILVDISPPSGSLLQSFPPLYPADSHQPPQSTQSQPNHRMSASFTPLAASMMALSILDAPIEVPTEPMPTTLASTSNGLEPPPYNSPPMYSNTSATSAGGYHSTATATMDPFDVANDDLANVARYGASRYGQSGGNHSSNSSSSNNTVNSPATGSNASNTVNYTNSSAPLAPVLMFNNLRSYESTNTVTDAVVTQTAPSTSAATATTTLLHNNLQSYAMADLEKNMYKNGAPAATAMQSNSALAYATTGAGKDASVSALTDFYANAGGVAERTYNNVIIPRPAVAMLKTLNQDAAAASAASTTTQSYAHQHYKHINTVIASSVAASTTPSSSTTSQVLNRIWFDQQQQQQQQTTLQAPANSSWMQMDGNGLQQAAALRPNYGFYNNVAETSAATSLPPNVGQLYDSVAGSEHYAAAGGGGLYGTVPASMYEIMPSMQPVVLYDEVNVDAVRVELRIILKLIHLAFRRSPTTKCCDRIDRHRLRHRVATSCPPNKSNGASNAKCPNTRTRRRRRQCHCSCITNSSRNRSMAIFRRPATKPNR